MQTTIAEIIAVLRDLAKGDTAFSLHFSNPQKDSVLRYRKITLRPFAAKGGLRFSMVAWDGVKEIQNTIGLGEVLSEKWLVEQLTSFKQLQIRSVKSDYHIFSNRDGSIRWLKRPPTSAERTMMHDRPKNYLLSEGQPIPFLVALGVMTKEGRVVKAEYDKFRQVNRFLETVRDIYEDLPAEDTLQVVDLGCGSALLTFALHYFLQVHYKRDLHIYGVDIKQETIAKCNDIAVSLRLTGISFHHCDIADWQPQQPVDLVVSLHACDTATDSALAQAIKWQSGVILAAPCCHHQLAGQLKNAEQAALLGHGILREKTAALISDALRAAALEMRGWSCTVMEFVDSVHTPKNLLIRAIKRRGTDSSALVENRQAAYDALKNTWRIETFALEEFLKTDY